MLKRSLFFYTLFFGAILAQSRSLPADTTVVTNHKTTIKNKRIEYKATTGTQPVWNEDGKPIAAVHYTYYERTDIKKKNTRPIMISFNGGPGSGSVWMHLAYTGPMILNVDDEGFPIQPYGVKSNPYSILDVADIVYVNPVNTGYSRIVDKEVKKETFFGVNADIKYLAEWINTFIQRVNRWESPKYLIGESYGTTRVSGLAYALQGRQWMYLNGVILVSPTELGIDSGSGRRAGPVGAALRVPYFTAAAWYHNKLPKDLQRRDLLDVLDDAEDYAVNELMAVIAKGGFVDEKERQEAARKMARYSGISEESILSYNLDVPSSFFWKELLREEGYTVGRLDSRYKGIDKTKAGDSPDFNSELTSWLHSFTPAINYYYKNVLKFETDMKYNMFGPVRPWDSSNNRTGENLRQAMAQNPYLHTMVQSGYYDGATKYFDAKYTMWRLDPSGRMKDRLSFKGYRSGHMM
ncbi:MAG: carboxypeptidase, partial [Candidatus Marinimicrobia bacterium]|nr:carboxypeptidase [Candidatus Neomarinimicrobiota bacterium]MBT4270252.1 carboxypeptidase [Candidatus Neomarinimicrobiota bacterium]MBT4371163.1 carboxypeptidase [Candidatus Neomarinimicrobiota bacterium]MBT5177050.1 carboxypeptidase [Candidatus Neomarinimicrobiota bacterium]MBT6417255.1 carboxypeptidase [Candidatus Neomarinimicrobiota bacterium]